MLDQVKASKALAAPLKEKISLILEKAQKRPGQRKKLLENVVELEEQLNQIRAEQGYLG